MESIAVHLDQGKDTPAERRKRLGEHNIKIEFSGSGMALRMVCNADDDALCKSRWECSCDGDATDYALDLIAMRFTHIGTDGQRHTSTGFAETCGIVEFFNADGLMAERFDGNLTTVEIGAGVWWTGDEFLWDLPFNTYDAGVEAKVVAHCDVPPEEFTATVKAFMTRSFSANDSPCDCGRCDGNE